MIKALNSHIKVVVCVLNPMKHTLKKGRPTTHTITVATEYVASSSCTAGPEGSATIEFQLDTYCQSAWEGTTAYAIDDRCIAGYGHEHNQNLQSNHFIWLNYTGNVENLW